MRRLACTFLVVTACGGPAAPTPTFDKATLMKPETCKQCHPDHFTQWASSMHAYAADDPVFRAMNARGQRETKGALGNFCVNCHAPLAVRSGATTDGLNLDSVPAEERGVTCFFCHTVDAVMGTHNAPLTLDDAGTTMFGGIQDPVANPAHHAAYSALHDRQVKDSSSLCGSCHDIVTPNGTALERTFAEWQGTIYSMEGARTLRTCGKCHMSGTQGFVASFPGVPQRELHEHAMDGIDVALTPLPDVAMQQADIQRDLLTALSLKLCVMPDAANTDVVVTLDNVAVGHAYPSGASQDRRSWVEIVAYSGQQVVFQSGVAPDGMEVTQIADPNLWLFRDQIFDGSGQEVHMFWDAASYTSSIVPPPVTTDPSDPRFYHAITKTYVVPGTPPDRVTARVRIRAVGLDVLQDLVASGDLDPKYLTQMTPLDLGGTVRTWDRAGGYGCIQ